MGFLLESPAQLADSQVLHLSPPWGALQDARRVCHHSLEHRLQIAGRPGDDLQRLGGRRRLRPGLGEFAPVRFELLFKIGTRLTLPTNACSHLRSGRTKTTNACSALRSLARQGHLVGTVTGPPSGWAQLRTA